MAETIVPFEYRRQRITADSNPIPKDPTVAFINLAIPALVEEIASRLLTGSRSRSGASSNVALKVRAGFRRESKTKEMGYIQLTHLVKPRMALKPSAFPTPGNRHSPEPERHQAVKQFSCGPSPFEPANYFA
jgi:hypothetical protein